MCRVAGEGGYGCWGTSGGREPSDSYNTLLLISLISSFLWLKVYYSGKSVAVVFARNDALPTWVTASRHLRSTGP